MRLNSPITLPSVRELQLRPCAEDLPRSKGLVLDQQSFYPSPSMSRRSSFKDDASHADQGSIPIAATKNGASSGITASTLLPTSTTSQQPRNFIHQFHPYSVEPDILPESYQRPQLQSQPSAGTRTDPAPSRPLQHDVPHYAIAPRTSSLNFSKPTRKSKQHVQSACANCKKAHLSCDDQRPCRRCEERSWESTCIDVPHRKRGRPRIREQIPNEAAPFPLDRRRQHAAAGRTQRPTDDKSTASPLTPTLATDGAELFNHARTAAQEPEPSQPVAFLDMSFEIVRVNKAFQNMFDFHGDLRGQSLYQLIDSSAKESLDALRNIRTTQARELDEKNPAYLPPIRPSGHHGVADIPPINPQDLSNLCQGYATSHKTLQLRSKESESLPMSVELCLARSGVIFVVLKISLLQSPQRALPQVGSYLSSSSALPLKLLPVQDIPNSAAACNASVLQFDSGLRSSVLTRSQAASSRVSSSPRNLKRPRQSIGSASQLSGIYNGTTSAPLSPARSTASYPPPISPVSPLSRQPYQHAPSFSTGGMTHTPQVLYSVPPDPFAQKYHSLHNPELLPRHKSSSERKQHQQYQQQHSTAPTYLLGPASAYKPTPIADNLKLPPITTLGGLSSSPHSRTRSATFADMAMNQSRQQTSHEQQARQRSADRERREQTQDDSPGNDNRQPQARKRKRGLDVSDITR